MTASSRAIAHLLHSLSCSTGPLGSMAGSALPLPALEELVSRWGQCCSQMNSQSSLLRPQVMDHPCLLADQKPHRCWTTQSLLRDRCLQSRRLASDDTAPSLAASAWSSSASARESGSRLLWPGLPIEPLVREPALQQQSCWASCLDRRSQALADLQVAKTWWFQVSERWPWGRPSQFVDAWSFRWFPAAGHSSMLCQCSLASVQAAQSPTWQQSKPFTSLRRPMSSVDH